MTKCDFDIHTLTNPMHIAFMSSVITDGNPTSGFEIANEAIVNGLRSLGHKVSVIGFSLPRQNKPEHQDVHVVEKLVLENATVSTLQKLEFVMRALKTGLPMSASKLTAVSNRKLKETMKACGEFDCVIFNSYQMATAFPELKKQNFGYVSHNVEHLSARQNARSASSKLQRWLYARDAELLEKIESNLCDRAGFVWTLSEGDLTTLKVPSDTGSILPLVAPLAESAPRDVAKEFDIGMIGTWSWEPNRVGLAWFLDHVAPILPDDFRVAIAGKVPEGMIRKDSRVSFLGRVESASAFLQAVRVVPLISRGGTGVQLKTIEAFQAGLACVATSSSLRGVEILPENCAQADEPMDFAKALKQQVVKDRNCGLPDVDGHQFYNDRFEATQSALRNGLISLA